ncbi:reverse transcriptase family protein [Undibacterium sp. Tian12W]|uniref:reverse transcriptase family protein n=1 Tax=Undibacterium sp. Tian12W TaxID=3413054 RepID=UPI003BEFFA97
MTQQQQASVQNASDKPLSQMTRDELYAHLRTTTKDAVVLQEMRRLGFWPADSGKPSVTDELITREAVLSKELNDLTAQLRRVQDPKAALRDMRKQRMAAAKEKRELTKQKHAQLRHAKALAWQEKRKSDIGYLGEGVSTGLNYTSTNADKLARYQLPALQKSLDLATAIGIPLAELRFMSFQRKVSQVSHYQRFAIPKKTGGQRFISAPMPRLKRCQYWVLDHILAKVPCHPAAHGFLPQHSILSNALPHVGQAVVINLDLKDFFPSIEYPRVKGVFKSLGYGDQIATLLGLLCTEQATEEVRVDTQKYFVAGKKRSLPQGAPSSPMITNILCHTLDKRLHAAATKLGFVYTRYADDLTFSSKQKERPPVGKLLWRVKQIIADEGFTLHPDKQHIMRHSQKQEVTGIVVNHSPTIDAKTLHRFRATLHQVEKNGPAGYHWNGNTDVLGALEGYARYVCMVNPAKGKPWLQRIKALRAQYATTQSTTRVTRPTLRQQVASGKTPQRANGQDWWQVQEAAAPVLEQTAQQVAEEKKAVKQAAKEEKKAAAAPKAGQFDGAKNNGNQATNAASAVNPENYTAAEKNKLNKRLYGTLGRVFQVLLCAIFSASLHSLYPLTFGIALISLGLITRRSSLVWVMVMLALSVVFLG